jgi:hypothetical protein
MRQKMFPVSVKFLPRVFFHMILRHQKYQSETTHKTFTLKISILHFYLNLTLRDTGTMLRRNIEENQNHKSEEFHQEPHHPSTCMKMVKERTPTTSAVNDERRQVLPSKVIWDGTLDCLEVFRNNFEGQHGKIGAG